MKYALCYLQSLGDYSQGRMYTNTEVAKLPDETHEAYERRTWRNRCHFDKDTGEVYIPAMQFANSLKATAKFMSDDLTIPGQGKSRYTKNFESGVLVLDDFYLGVKVNEIDGITVAVPSDGRRGGTTRVIKTFPIVHHWEGAVTYSIFDDKIPNEVFERVLQTCGMLIGIGRFRPANWGTYGRFAVSKQIIWLNPEEYMQYMSLDAEDKATFQKEHGW